MKRMRALLPALLLAACGCGAEPAAKPEVAPGRAPSRHAAEDLAATTFLEGPVVRFVVELSPANLQSLRNEPRKSVPATVTVGTNRYVNVAVHVKGAAGSTRGIDDNPALTLNFDKLVPGRRFHGLDKLHLNNSVQDSSILSEQLGARMYRTLGIPTARASQAMLTLCGRDLGLYGLKEGYNRSFLRRNFPDPSGNLYDGGFVRDIDQDLERDSGDGPDDHKDLQRLREAAMTGDPKIRGERLEAALDTGRFVTEMAMQAILVDWDGYGYNRNNYRLYHRPDTGRFTFIPHGMDQLLGNIGRNLDPPQAGLVAQRIFDLPEYREKFFAEIERILAGVYTRAALTNHFHEAMPRVMEALRTRPKDEQDWRLNSMRAFQHQAFNRIEIAGRHLAGRPKPIRFDAGGSTALVHWQPRFQRGQARIEFADLGGVKTLHLEAQARDTVSSFRATIRLPIGRYAVTGRVRTRALRAADDQRYKGGAAFRTSGGEHQARFEGDTDWKEFRHEFQVADPRDVELVAELRAHSGEAWFDLPALRLRKLP